MEEGRNCRSFINALLRCAPDLHQLGLDALAQAQREHADSHRALHAHTAMQGLGQGAEQDGHHPELRSLNLERLRSDHFSSGEKRWACKNVAVLCHMLRVWFFDAPAPHQT